MHCQISQTTACSVTGQSCTGCEETCTPEAAMRWHEDAYASVNAKQTPQHSKGTYRCWVWPRSRRYVYQPGPGRSPSDMQLQDGCAVAVSSNKEIQQVPTGSWAATTCKLASVLSDLGCSTAPQHNHHPLLCPGWKPEARERAVRHTFRSVVAVIIFRKNPCPVLENIIENCHKWFVVSSCQVYHLVIPNHKCFPDTTTGLGQL
jgi:hypothetical protein